MRNLRDMRSWWRRGRRPGTTLSRPLHERYPQHVFLVRGQRLGRWLIQHHVPVVPTLLRFLLLAVFSADVPFTIDLPPDVIFMHNGLGTVIHGKTRFRGPAIVFQNVTVGNSYGGREGAPEIGSYVVIGVGACILGGITVGDYTLIGSNAVVTRDVPPLHQAAGNPAKVTALDPAYIRRMWDVDPG